MGLKTYNKPKDLQMSNILFPLFYNPQEKSREYEYITRKKMLSKPDGKDKRSYGIQSDYISKMPIQHRQRIPKSNRLILANAGTEISKQKEYANCSNSYANQIQEFYNKRISPTYFSHVPIGAGISKVLQSQYNNFPYKPKKQSSSLIEINK